MRCFVIGPIGDQLGEIGSPERTAYEDAIEVFEEVVRAACASLDIEPYRADHITDTGEIPDQIFTALRDEPLVIADLTGANPNVMYELGVRHVTGKCTIQIGEKGRLPFDVSTIRTILFKRSPAGLVQARQSLVRAIGSALANGCAPSGPARILALAGDAIGPSTADDRVPPPVPVPDETDELEAPMGILEASIELLEGMPAFTDRLTALAATLAEVNTLTREHAELVGAATKPAHKLGRVATFAKALRPVATRFDDESLEVDSRTQTLHLAVEVLVREVERGGYIDEPDVLLDSLESLGSSAKEARDAGILGFLDSLRKIENTSRELRPVINLLQAASERTSADFELIASWVQLAGDARRAIANRSDG